MPDDHDYFGGPTLPEEPAQPPDEAGEFGDAWELGDATPAATATATAPRVTTIWLLAAVLLPVVLAAGLIRWAGIRAQPDVVTGASALSDESFTLWASNDDGSAVRWNACEPIRWTFNPSGAPFGAVTELQKAMDRITEVSGLTFEYLGETHELPSRERSPWLPETYDPTRWAPVLIAWRTPETTNAPLGDHDRAVAIPVAVGTSADRVFVTAQVIFNTELAGTPGFTDRRRSIGITMLHELLHVIGLGHVDDTAEIMFPFPVAGNADFGPGDLAGMAAVGADLGCLDVPEPEHIEVTYAE